MEKIYFIAPIFSLALLPNPNQRANGNGPLEFYYH